jgi:hypothetical protein
MATTNETERCRHGRINLLGNEETGLRSARCEDCGIRMVRRPAADGSREWDYFPAPTDRETAPAA